MNKKKFKNQAVEFTLTLLLACVAGGIVGAWNNVLTAELLKVSGKAVRRMGRRTLKYHLHENHGFLNSPHTSVKYTHQSNVK